MCNPLCHLGPTGAANTPTVQEMSASTAILPGGSAELEFYLPFEWTLRSNARGIRLSWDLGSVLPSALTLTARVDIYDGFGAAAIRSVPVGDFDARALSSFDCGDQTDAIATCILWGFPNDPSRPGEPLTIGRSPYAKLVIAAVNADGANAVNDLTVVIPCELSVCTMPDLPTIRPVRKDNADACLTC